MSSESDYFYDALNNGDLRNFKKFYNKKYLKNQLDIRPLHEAACNGYLGIVKWLIESQIISVNTKDNGGFTPLHSASSCNQLKVVRYLLKNGAKVNLRNKKKQTALDVMVAYDSRHHNPVSEKIKKDRKAIYKLLTV